MRFSVVADWSRNLNLLIAVLEMRFVNHAMRNYAIFCGCRVSRIAGSAVEFVPLLLVGTELKV